MIICGTSSSNNDADVRGLAVTKPVSISEVNEDNIELNGIDPIYLLLLSLRRVFWQQLLQKYPFESQLRYPCPLLPLLILGCLTIC